MYFRLNNKQKEELASFFTNLAVGWFTAAFIVTAISPDVTVFTFTRYLVNMVGAVSISLLLLRGRD